MDDLVEAGDRKVIKARLKPGSTEQMGLRAALGVDPDGTERHMGTHRAANCTCKLFIISVWSL